MLILRRIQIPALFVLLTLALTPVQKSRAEIDLAGTTRHLSCSELFVPYSIEDLYAIENYRRPLTNNARRELGQPPLDISSELQRLESFDPARDLLKIAEDFGNGTMRTWVQSGGILRKLLREYNVPRRGWRYYDHATGTFNYKPEKALQLAFENGEAPLQAIHLNYDHADDGFRDLLVDYKAVLAALPNLQFIIVTPAEDYIELRRYLMEIFGKNWSKNIRIVETDEPKIYVWAQDASKPLIDGLATVLPLQNESSSRPSYRTTVQDMARAGVIKVIESNFIFDGGNVIVGRKHVFVGPDVVARAMHEYRISRSEALDALTKEFDKPIIELGFLTRGNLTPNLFYLNQVDFHIDLTMAIVRDQRTDQEVAVVQSPGLLVEQIFGVDDIRQLSPAQFAQAKLQWLNSLHDQVLEGELHMTENERGFIAQMNSHSLETLLNWELQAEHVAKILEYNGYPVVRIPGINVLRSRTRVDTYNYTNSIFSGDLALVPQYDVRWTDEPGHAVYQSLGYRTIPMSSTQTYICQQGGIRCVSETYRHPVYETAPDQH